MKDKKVKISFEKMKSIFEKAKKLLEQDNKIQENFDNLVKIMAPDSYEPIIEVSSFNSYLDGVNELLEWKYKEYKLSEDIFRYLVEVEDIKEREKDFIPYIIDENKNKIVFHTDEDYIKYLQNNFYIKL